MEEKIDPTTLELDYIYDDEDFKKLSIERNFKFTLEFENKEYDEKSNKENKKRIIRGYASTADKDRADDVITMDALMKSKDDLLKQGSRTIFFNHDRSFPIGKVISTEIDNKGLIIEGEISKADDVGNIWTKIQEKILNALSIGGRFKKVRIERDGEGKILSFQVLELELFEVSVVGIPMNPKASIFSVVEKSFRNISKNIEEEKLMKKEEKKEELSKVEKNLTKEEIVNLINDQINTQMTNIKGAIETLTNSVKVVLEKKDEVKKDEVKKDEVKKDEVKDEKSFPEWASKLQADIDSLKELIVRHPSRRGLAEGDDLELEENDIPKKALVDKNDPESVEYVKYVMENSDAYESLSKTEKEKASSIYFSLMVKKTEK